MDRLIEWLEDEDHRRQINEAELQMIYHSLNENQVAIRVANVFPVTFANITGVR